MRPWLADPFLESVNKQFVTKEKSIAKLLQYSPVAKDLFIANQQACDAGIVIGSNIRDFAFAPQRFASEAKTLCRLVITFDAAMTTASQLIAHRGRQCPEGVACQETLDFVNEETCIQLGMLADAALQAQGLIRVCDDPEADEAELPGQFQRHVNILHRLFTDGEVVRIPGLTKIMLDTLRKPRTYIVRGQPKTLGSLVGPDSAIVDRCLARMKAYTMLVQKVVEAEFPYFELLAAFRVFSLSKHKTDVEDIVEADQQTCLQKLASCVGVSEQDLVMQFKTNQPYAKAYYTSHDTTNFDAWAETVRRLNHDQTALRAVLVRYGAWQASSTECERTFSKTLRLRGGQCEDQFVERELDIIQLQSDPLDTSEENRIIDRGMKLWIAFAGRPRVLKRPRIDCGVNRPKVCRPHNV